MEEVVVKRFCENCKKDALHVAREDALEIEYICKECDKQSEIIKTFF